VGVGLKLAGVSSACQGGPAVPTILRVQGFRVYFWSSEPNEPPHVHLDRGGASAKVWLEPVLLASNVGFSAHDLGVILRLVRDHQPKLLEAWHEFFGTG
jgi:hypothetical protein